MTWEIRESREEEVANALLHGVGAAMGMAVLAVMVVLSALYGTALDVVASAVFGASLVLLYTASTLYHAFPWPRAKQVMEVMDHAAIYVLIAGTYTPFALVALGGAWGWSMFGVVWGLAAIGIAAQAIFPGRVRGLMTALYVVMPWVVVIAGKPLLSTLAPAAIAWLAAGGVVYSVGVFFYYKKRFPFSHAVWHLFVLGGSACHVVAVLNWVVPRAA